MAGREKTALGIARARFVEGLPSRSRELRAALDPSGASGDPERLREEIRRRLHALYASAQVFREEQLAEAIKRTIDDLDRARDARRPLSEGDWEALLKLADSLPSLASNETGTPSLGRRPDSDMTGEARVARSSLLPDPATGPRKRTSSSPFLQPSPDPAEAADAPATEAGEAGQSPRPSEPQPQADARHSPLPPGPETSGADRPLPSESEQRSSLPPTDKQLSRQEAASVLVVDEVETQAEVKLALPEERYEVLGSSDAEEALKLARSGSPDVVLVAESMVRQGGADLVRRLRADPLTELVPVVLIAGQQRAAGSERDQTPGIDETLVRPIDPEALVRTLARLLEPAAAQGSPLDGVEEASVKELEQLVAREIRRGLSGSLSGGGEQRISLGDGSEVLAAVWSAISRMRVFLAQRSGGGIRFRDAPGRAGPAMLALVDTEGKAEDKGPQVELRGRRILVADDDPAVLWFFSGLLKEAGAAVIEADNGKRALRAARRQRPDLLISDILMPEIDGFELCRELKGDVALADVPVILISWKEDFLQRMRELGSGASAYLTKEAGSARILARVRDALRPLARLEAGLRAGGVVRGRIEGIGVLCLLETVSRERPDSRITVRDARSLFEIDLRRGNLVALTQTASDGAFVRGRPALERVLGSGAARFTVMDADEPLRDLFGEPLPALLRKATNRLGALLDALSDGRLLELERLEFDEDILEPMLEGGPGSARDLLQYLRAGASPRQLVLERRIAPRQLASVLDDLARRGAVRAVLGADDRDLVAEALRRREQSPDTLFSSPPPEPAAPSTDRTSLPAGPRGWILEPDRRATTRESAGEENGLGFAHQELQSEFRLVSKPPPVPEEASRGTDGQQSPRSTEPGPLGPRGIDANADAVDGPGDSEARQGPRAAAAANRPSGIEGEISELAAAGRRSTTDEANARRARGGGGPLLLVALLLVAVYAGWKLVAVGGTASERSRWPAPLAAGAVEKEPPAIERGSGAATSDRSAPDDEEEVEEAADRRQRTGDEEEADVSWGSVLPFIDRSRGVEVGEEQGLLVIESESNGDDYKVRVNGRNLGRPPVSVALEAGRHELRFKRRGSESSFRFVVVEKGRTRVVQTP